MDKCKICEEPLSADAKSCPVCGTVVPPEANADTHSLPPGPREGPIPRPIPPLEAAAGARQCPECHKEYAADYADAFCTCGAELRAAPSPPVAPEPPPGPVTPPPPVRPPTGTPCLILYSAGQPAQPLCYQPLDKDVTLIGRTDAVQGTFPDLDVSRYLDGEIARKASRKHAVVLRSRQTGTFVLRPLARNTGTRIETEPAAELQDHPLPDGARIILGGAIRLKFEVMK